MKKRFNIFWPICLSLVLFSFSTAEAEIFGDYVGVKECNECHEDVVEGWKTTPHAHAFENLAKQGEEKKQNPGCVKCHVVAYDAEGGFIDMDLTPELKDVQCESCHGPGNKHMETEEAEDIFGKPDESVCRVCHTEGQDKNFDYQQASKWVHGEIKKESETK